MGCGRLDGWTATIHPFADNPTFGLPVVFYGVPASNPDGPASPFVDRFWDQRENWLPPGVGMDPTSFKPYFGPRPDATVRPLVGTADQWANGLSYAVWQAGGYSNPNGCVAVASQFAFAKMQEVESITFDLRARATLDQAENLNVWTVQAQQLAEAEALWQGTPPALAEAEAVDFPGVTALIAEAEALWQGTPAALAEAEAMNYGGAVAAVAEAEAMPVQTNPPGFTFTAAVAMGAPGMAVVPPVPNLVGLSVTGPCVPPGTVVLTQMGPNLTLSNPSTCTTTSTYTFH
jgi:hypothetical protein